MASPLFSSKKEKELIKNASFDYQTYFKENSISEEQLHKSIAEAIAENQALADEIKGGNAGKSGILVGKVLAKVGKGANGKLVREIILQQLAGTVAKSESESEEDENGEVKISAAQQRDDEEDVGRCVDHEDL